MVSHVHGQYEYDSSTRKPQISLQSNEGENKPLYIALHILHIDKHTSFSHQEKYDGFEGASSMHPL
jgi:hypothetical protein